MGERILDALQHLAVELGVGAVQFELDVFAEFGGKVSNNARQLLPSVADRLHARAHDAVLQFGGDVGESLQRHLEFGFVVAAHDIEELIAGQHQLGHHGHQAFQRVDAHANRFAGDRGLDFFLLGSVDILGLAVLRLALLGLDPRRRRSRCRTRRVAERTLQFVERNFARKERPFQRLRHQPADGVRDGGGGRSGRRRAHLAHHLAKLMDQVGVGPFRLALVGFELGEDLLDPVDGEQHQRHRLTGDRRAVAKFAHQAFRGMGQPLKPRQAEKTAGALDGMDEAEHVAENLGIVGLLLEANEFDVDHVEALVSFDQEFLEQVVHRSAAFARGTLAP